MARILVVDNEKSLCDFLTILLEKEGYEVATAPNGEVAVRLINENDFDMVLTDIRMPRSDGIDVLAASKSRNPNTPVVMMTAFASAETAVEAMKKGAYDYISKPFKVEDLQLLVKNALDKKRLEDENRYLKTALWDKHQFGNIVGKSPSMHKVFDYIQKVTDSNATVLITGESGTGKEMVARAIHFSGARKNHPFVSVNCGAVPETLLESELFGYEKGAFTGADSAKIGLMEAADKGTFFLDEIFEAPLTVQVKLLRVLQEREMTRVGGIKPRRVDIRFIAATNKDLTEAVKNKTFREDLFYRIHVIPIQLPALRERREDIPLLVDHFIKKFNEQHNRKLPIRGIDADALNIMEAHHWPGNVRELENVIERAVVLEVEDTIQVHSLPDEIQRRAHKPVDFLPGIEKQPVDLEVTMEQIEKKILQGALEQSDGVISKAAKLLNLSFRSMRYRLQKHNLKGEIQD
jgi:two-component system response regulator PilR (NtrC family)